jgi:hypothetical protein
VKNLKKLLKKYEEMMDDSFSFNFSHLRSKYILTSSNKVEAENINENNREAQLSKNSGDSIPFSRN